MKKNRTAIISVKQCHYFKMNVPKISIVSKYLYIYIYFINIRYLHKHAQRYEKSKRIFDLLSRMKYI